MKSTMTFARCHDTTVGDTITFEEVRPWWKKLYRWIFRIQDPVLKVTNITKTTFTYENVPRETFRSSFKNSFKAYLKNLYTEMHHGNRS